MTILTNIWVSFIVPHWLDILVGLTLIIIFIVSLRKMNMAQLAHLGVLAITRVEEWYKSEIGQVKMAEAIKWVRSQSMIISFLFSTDKIELIIQEEFYKLKKTLAEKAAAQSGD